MEVRLVICCWSCCCVRWTPLCCHTAPSLGSAHSHCCGSHTTCVMWAVCLRGAQLPGEVVWFVMCRNQNSQCSSEVNLMALRSLQMPLPTCQAVRVKMVPFLSFFFCSSSSLTPSQMVVLLTTVRKLLHSTLHMSPEVSGFADPFWVAVTSQVWRSVLFFTWAGSKVTLWVFPAVNLNTSFRAQSTQQHKELEGIKCQTNHSLSSSKQSAVAIWLDHHSLTN